MAVLNSYFGEEENKTYLMILIYPKGTSFMTGDVLFRGRFKAGDVFRREYFLKAQNIEKKYFCWFWFCGDIRHLKKTLWVP